MKKAIILILSVIALSWGCQNSSTTGETKGADSASFKAIDTTKLAVGTPYYQCLMHPEVITDKPGNCVKCGDMPLEKRVKQ